jgi:hypothetical protein
VIFVSDPGISLPPAAMGPRIMASDKDEVGYGKPPKRHRFKKGQSGNPAGRPRKEKPNLSARALIDAIASEEVEIGGRKMTLRELELRAIHHKAAKGDVTASRHLMKLREQAGCDQPAGSGGGVLVVPSPVPIDEWSIAAARQQAKFRTRQAYDEDD